MTRDRRNRFLLSVIISAFIYTTFLTLFMKVLAPKKMSECVRCKMAIAAYMNAQRGKNNNADTYNESLYNQGGGINPGFKNIVSNKRTTSQESEIRDYERQLAEYRQIIAEKEKARKEAERLEALEAAKEKALLEQERLERLQAQQELQKATNISTKGGVGASKTFTPKNTKQPTQQKTQIGTLRTSKLGESTFQKQQF